MVFSGGRSDAPELHRLAGPGGALSSNAESLAIGLNHFLWMRPDDVVSQVMRSHRGASYIFIFATLTVMVASFVSMNRVWIETLWWKAAFAGASILICAFIPVITRYLWFAIGLGVLIGVCVRCGISPAFRRALAGGADLDHLFLAGRILYLPFLLGSAALQVISFEYEIWWYSVGGWLSILPVVSISRTISIGSDRGSMVGYRRNDSTCSCRDTRNTTRTGREHVRGHGYLSAGARFEIRDGGGRGGGVWERSAATCRIV